MTHRLFGLGQRSYFNVFAPGTLANHGLGIALAFNVGSTLHPGCNNSSANPNHPPVRFAYAYSD